MVTRTQAIQRIKDGLGFRRATNLDDRIILRLQEAQRELEAGKTLPEFLKVSDHLVTLVAGTQTAFVPFAFLREDYTEPMYFRKDNDPKGKKVFLNRVDADDAFTLYWNNGLPASPRVYVVRRPSPTLAWTLDFVNPVDRDYTFHFSFYEHDTDIGTTESTKWLAFAPEWIIGEAGIRMAADARDPDGVSLFGDMMKKGRLAVLGETLMSETAVQPIQMGSAN